VNELYDYVDEKPETRKSIQEVEREEAAALAVALSMP
jgi:hypothetical protein